MSRTHGLLAATALLAAALLVITLRRVPTPFADSQLYASIARAEQLHGSGVPTWMRHSPVAVDHVPFYGPVFFTLAARAFDAFGVSLGSFRLVSLMGALLILVAGALLAQSISGVRGRWLWAATLLLLAPEIRLYATVGTMDTIAVGLEALALTAFIQGLSADRKRRWLWFAPASGMLLVLAALTTPRTYPFLFSFFAAGVLLPCATPEARRRAWRQLAVTAITFTVGLGAWAIVSHGDPIRWARYMAFIATHEDMDVALLPSADRMWLFSWAMAATPLVAVIGAITVAARLSRRNGGYTDERAGAAGFALLTGWITLVSGAVTMNLTFTLGTYVALPLFVVVLALPYDALAINRRRMAMAVAMLLSLDAGLAGVWYARVAATWAARDPEPLYAFFRTHVPAGSAVVGPQAPYFIAVERSGSHFRVVTPESWADWARWVPIIEPEAVAAARRVPARQSGARYFVWHADEDIPDEYACASAHQVAVYQPSPNRLDLLGWLGRRTWDTGYPKSILYSLPQGCPMGYDPTHS